MCNIDTYIYILVYIYTSIYIYTHTHPLSSVVHLREQLAPLCSSRAEAATAAATAAAVAVTAARTDSQLSAPVRAAAGRRRAATASDLPALPMIRSPRI
jgi:hypothetical protein